MVRTSSRSKSNKAPQKASNKTKKVTKISKVNGSLSKKSSKNGSIKKAAPKKSTKSIPKKGTKISSPIESKLAKPASKKATQKKSAPTMKGYTSDQYQKFLSQKKRLNGFSNQKLKDMLRTNLQSMSGNKDELIAKVADGIVLGRIPRCPTCFGGRPKFDYKSGTYHCSGYRDDQDFKNCHTTYQLDQIKRDPWE